MQCHCTRLIQVNLLCNIYCKIPLVKQNGGGLGLSLIKYKTGHVKDTYKWKVWGKSTDKDNTASSNKRRSSEKCAVSGVSRKLQEWPQQSTITSHLKPVCPRSDYCLSICAFTVSLNSIKLKCSALQSCKDVKKLFFEQCIHLTFVAKPKKTATKSYELLVVV
jgi:hypothetical protein